MLDELGMTRVEQSVQSLALPQQPDVDPATQPGRNSVKRVNRHSVRATPFYPPHHGPRNAGFLSELFLGPTAPSAQGPETEP